MMYLIVGLIIALDFATGLLKAFKEKAFTSSVMREGLFHKSGEILCVIFGAVTQRACVYFDLGVNAPIAKAFCTYVILMECGSIAENIGVLCPKIIPNKLKSYFTKLKE